MRKTILSLMALASLTAVAQNPTVPSVTENVVEDFKPASTNQENKQYPMINSQRMVRAQITAPKASFVGLDIAGKIYEMTTTTSSTSTVPPYPIRAASTTMVPAVGAVVSTCPLPTRSSTR